MEKIKIIVNRQMDGYSFSLTPTMRTLVKNKYPDSHPANNIFVSYETKSDFEFFNKNLENYLFPVLLGISNFKKNIQILFIDTFTGKILFEIDPNKKNATNNKRIQKNIFPENYKKHKSVTNPLFDYIGCIESGELSKNIDQELYGNM